MKLRTRLACSLAIALSVLGSADAIPPILPENLPPGTLSYFANAGMTTIIGVEVIPCTGERSYAGATSGYWHHSRAYCGGGEW